MLAVTSAEEGFAQTMEALKLLLGLKVADEQPFLTASQFGFHGYTISVYQFHLDYLTALSSALVPCLPAFDGDSINRWRLVNELLAVGLVRDQLETSSPSVQFPALAALAAFPTLEEIARRLSNRWDEEGKLLTEVSLADGVSTRRSDGTDEPKTYKAGHRIVVLAHKLQLLDLSLDPRLRNTTASLDAIFRRPMVDGLDVPMSSMYERLQFFRDQWVHGRRFEGWEALLISLYLALLYFGTLRLRNASNIEPAST